MEWGRKVIAGMLSLFLMFAFVQSLGGYLIEQLRLNGGQVVEQPAEEKIIRQMVLQLDPVEYYTVQVGAYQTAAEGQMRVNELAALGYRVWVSQGPPYQLWLGCFGKAPALADLPEAIRTNGDVFVQKQILNETTFKFATAERQTMEQVAALLSSLNVVLTHSLQMFQDYRYDACAAQTWADMTAQIAEELAQIQSHGDVLLQACEAEAVQTALTSLLDAAAQYQERLALIPEKQSDQAVLLAQSCLLELIARYHHCMTQCSVHQ